MEEPPAGCSLHKFYMERSTQFRRKSFFESFCINPELFEAMIFLVNLPNDRRPQSSQPSAPATRTLLQSSTAVSVSTQQEECGLSVEEVADVLAEPLLVFPPGHTRPRASRSHPGIGPASAKGPSAFCTLDRIAPPGFLKSL